MLSPRIIRFAYPLSVLASIAAARAQSPGPTFEVASIKASRTSDFSTPAAMGFNPGDRFTATNATLLQLVSLTFRFQEYQVVDVPDWARSERFDILAKADGIYPPADNGAPSDLVAMLRALLADRFKLAVHRETRTLPEFELVRARSDGRLGPHLRAVDADCAAVLATRRTGRPSARPADAAPADACAFRVAPGVLIGRAIQTSDIASALSSLLGRVVTNQTGLDGYYDVDLLWTAEVMQVSPALEEQLGLKLEPSNGPVDVLVVDHVEHPVEN